MDKCKVIQYVEQGREIELVEQLELLGLKEYNDKYKTLLEILVVLLNSSENSFLPIQQFLFRSIYQVLPEVLRSEGNINELLDILNSNFAKRFENLSHFISRFILNIEDNVDGLKKLNNIALLQNRLKKLNVALLKEIIAVNGSYKVITQVFYNCVDKLAPNRRIILHKDAVNCFYSYVNSHPSYYLAHFIRPYYTGPTKFFAEYYLHVPEPFCEQIFEANQFEQFLQNLVVSEDVEQELIIDVRSFYTKAKSSQNQHDDKAVMLFSIDNEESSKKDTHLKLLSRTHEHVRDSCKPPDYISND